MSDPGNDTGIAERKLITALFCDLIGSTALGERLDPETLRRVQAAYFDRLRAVIEGHEGIVEKFIGDAVVAIFGVPVTHEDDAERAVRCAIGMRDAMAGLNDTLRPRFGVELAVRIGVDSGEAVVTGRAADAIATGDVLNTAARLEAAARPGEILVGRDTMELARESVVFDGPRSVEAKGKAELVEAWVPSELAAQRIRPRAPLVGRVAELEVLGAALERAIHDTVPQVVFVLGEPGIGKSRLSEEFATRAVGRASVLRGACRSYGEDTTWRPVVDVIRGAAEIPESTPQESAASLLRRKLERAHPPEEVRLIEAQLAPLIGAGRSGTASGGEVLWAIRRFLEAMAAHRPTVVVLDDLHWASDTLLETLEELVETVAPVPLLLVCQGRPELRERMAGTMSMDRTTVITLQGLSDGEAARLVAELQGDVVDDAPPPREDRSAAIVAQAAGNPLYLEEIASMAAQQAGPENVPRSIHALIAARLDLLASETKLVGQAASVVGEVFWAGSVAAALSNGGRPDTAPALRTLRTRGLIEEQSGSAFLGDRQFVFHHALIRDVAYASLPKHRRADMHRRVASWMTPFAADRPELWRGVGHHWERALALAVEVEPLGPPDPDVRQAAALSLLAAGRWAQSNAALPEAVDLLRRAAAASAGSSLEALCSACLALALAIGGELQEAERVARSVSDDAEPRAAANAALALATVELNHGNAEGLRPHAVRAVELAQRAGAPEVEAQALDALGWADFWVSSGGADYEKAQRTWERVTELAKAAGDLTAAARARAWGALAGDFRLDVAGAERGLEEAMALAEEAGSLRALVAAHVPGARTRQLQGRLEEALEYGRRWFDLSMQAGERLEAVAACAFGLAPPLRLLGRPDESWAATEEGIRIAGQIKDSAYESSVRWERIRLLLSWGRIDQAEEELSRIEAITDLSDEEAYRLWGSVAAPVRAAQGRDHEAEDIWRRTVGRAEADWFVSEVLIGFADFLLDRGRVVEAKEIVDRTAEIVEGTGATLLERQVEGLRARLG